MSDYLGNIKGPEGTPGPIGPQGPAGADGTVSFDELTPEQQNSLVGPQGPKGDTGVQGPKGDSGEQGPKGDIGDTGSDGEAGFSPTVQINEIENGTNVIITDFDGPKTFDVMNGEPGLGIEGPKGDPGEQGPKGDPGKDNLDIYYNKELKENYKINFLSPYYNSTTLSRNFNGIELIDDNNKVVKGKTTILNGPGGITYVDNSLNHEYSEVVKPSTFCTTEPYKPHLKLVDTMNENSLVFNENKIVCGEYQATLPVDKSSDIYDTTYTSVDEEGLRHLGNGFGGEIRRFPLFEINSDFIYNGETYKTNSTTLRNYVDSWQNGNGVLEHPVDFILDLVHINSNGIIDKTITCSFHCTRNNFRFDSSLNLKDSNTITITKIKDDTGGASNVDDELSETSENPVQNKVVTAAVEEINSNLIDFGKSKLLWSGTFTSGSITVPGLSDYLLLLVSVSGAPCLGDRNYGGTLHGGYASYAIGQMAYRFSGSGNTLTIDDICKGGTDGTTQQPVTAICGLIRN